MKALFVFAALACLAVTSEASEPRNDLWEAILRARVNESGEVAYRTLSKLDGERLAEYLASLATVDPWKLDRDQAIAFWINAYNAMVVFGVIHGGNPETLAGRAQLYHWFQLELAGSRRTVDGIAGLLERFAAVDPRIHFALCNATRGGPSLAAKPYVAEDLDASLADAARRFVNDPAKNRVDLARRRVDLSRLFVWHQPDFERTGGSLPGFVGDLVKHPKAGSILRRPEMSTGFLEFDWRLNAAEGERPF
ncbi:MAG: DUF547 domain-containing protein [Candidatus Binatia bacterium]